MYEGLSTWWCGPQGGGGWARWREERRWCNLESHCQTLHLSDKLRTFFLRLEANLQIHGVMKFEKAAKQREDNGVTSSFFLILASHQIVTLVNVILIMIATVIMNILSLQQVCIECRKAKAARWIQIMSRDQLQLPSYSSSGLSKSSAGHILEEISRSWSEHPCSCGGGGRSAGR